MAIWAEKIPAQPQEFSLLCLLCGAESVPKKNLGLPEVAAVIRACWCGFFSL